MNVNVNKLKGKIVENGMTVSALAEKIGVDGETMLVKDANAIVSALHLTAEDALAIFFSQVVA